MFDETAENHREYKGFTLTRIYPQSMWKITKDGKVVKELSSLYTMTRLAVAHIDAYLVKLDKADKAKVKKDK